MSGLVSELVEKVSEKSELQKKYFEKWIATEEEIEELDILLRFFVEELHHDIDYIVDAYLFINYMVREETYYFIRHGRYRYSSADEVNRIVYSDTEYMERYMTGLSVSDYIWIPHIKMLRYFKENIDIFSGESYLEIGPGFGQYLVKILSQCKFKEYTACDISRTSVDKCNRYLKYRNLSDQCMVVERNFLEFRADRKFDCIVMGEVLEHVEDPLIMLRKIYEILHPNGKAFISTVINAPTIDHIFLFSNIKEVLDMTEAAGFKVLDYLCVMEGDVPLERALKRKQAVDIAMILEK